MSRTYFDQQSFEFLNKLAKNNQRDWFQTHKQQYEDQVRGPALALITDMADSLAMISPHFLALPKKVGGSMMRPFRDTRFSKDKSPYKTNVGIQFRHEMGKDVHAPGFYLHVEPGNCFLGVGIWRPDSLALNKIRTRIDEHSEQWLAAINNSDFAKQFHLDGDCLKNAPRAYAKDHPLLEHLKRKDFIAIQNVDDAWMQQANLCRHISKQFELASPLMQFLCKALELRF